MSARVFVGVHGSLGSLQALRRAVAEARERQAVLVAVLAWTPPGGEVAYRRAPCPPLHKVQRELAEQRLTDAFDAALGGIPTGLPVETRVVCGPPGPVLVSLAARPDDLLVVGSGRTGVLRRAFGLQPPVVRHFSMRAACPVLVVPPSAMVRDLRRRPLQRGKASV
ncbi:nucleotide-binding universal stress UspA family protein [Catenulispora sp. MAP12-49]|uniref:universal stress protein n=1 Tax=Catenulispora sp. MAP12-49 TaxID=3156302 RepID=UPI0035180441